MRSDTSGDEDTMSDKPLKPVINKPPGFRDPNSPPSGGAPTLPRRRPTPVYFEKKRRWSRRRICCCSVCIFLAVIFVLLLITVATFFIWYNPKLPVIRLASLKITTFNFTDGKSDDGWSFLTADTTALLDFRNPNGKLRYEYSNADVAVTIGENDFEISLGSTKVKGFFEKPGNRTAVIIPTKVRNQKVDDPTAKRLRAELKSKRLLVKVTAKTKVGLGVGSRNIVTVDATIKCGGVRLQTLDSQMAKCKIKILKWINLKS